MNTLYRGLIAASLLLLGACETRETRAENPRAGADAPPPPVVRTPTPESKPQPIVETPVAPPVAPPTDEQGAPSNASAELLARAIAGIEARAVGLRTSTAELRSAVEALGENATLELRDGASGLATHLADLELKLTELRSAGADKLDELEGAAKDAADELERRTAALKALLP